MFLSLSSVVTTEIRSSSSVEVLALVDLHSNNNMSQGLRRLFLQPLGRLSLMMEVFNVKQYYLEFILLYI